jgi:hypothetical protein
MGAALTYARRYALFTLVGIAGEDDLDAPDLQDRVVLPPPSAVNGAGNGFAGAGGPDDDLARKSHSTATGRRQGGRGRREHRSLLPSILPAAPSAELRDQLSAEIAAITTSEQAEAWAATALPIKNTLSGIDAEAIEQAFERKLIEFAESVDVVAESPVAAEQGKQASHLEGNRTTEFRDQALRSELGADPQAMTSLRSAFEGKAVDTSKGPPSGIDKSVLAISEPSATAIKNI